MLQRISSSVFIVLLSAFALFAQETAPDREKLKSERRTELIDAILADAAQLRLPENRALVSAKLGAVIWIVKTFAQKDFARTMTLVGSFSRREIRILMLISLLESGV